LSGPFLLLIAVFVALTLARADRLRHDRRGPGSYRRGRDPGLVADRS
jgi:hypothetical protein